MPSIFTPCLPSDDADFLLEFGAAFATTGSVTFGATFLTGDFFGVGFFGAEAAFCVTGPFWATGVDFFGAFLGVVFAGTVAGAFFATDFSGAFLEGLFVVVFVFIIDEILVKVSTLSKAIAQKKSLHTRNNL